MLDRFDSFIREEHLIADGQRVLLAVSGGRDSVTLCDLMHRRGTAFGVAHCNFNLRPGDCDRDEDFVRDMARHYGVSFYPAHFNTTEYANNKGLSIEEAARNLRYGFFEEVRQSEGYDLIATAHHRDDSIETFFINLLRGTGIAGLHGIMPCNGNIIRPLLPFGRKDIDRYVSERGLRFVEDYTNSQPLFLRNRIRLQLIPLLREMSPTFDATMQENIEHLRSTEQVYRSAVESVSGKLLRKDGEVWRIDIEALSALSPLKTYLFEILHRFGFSSSVCDNVVQALHAQSGRQFFSHSHRLVKDRDCLLIVPRTDRSDEIVQIYSLDPKTIIPLHDCSLRAACMDSIPIKIKLSRHEAIFDLEKLVFPLSLRHWRRGDRFVPFGMNGSRLVSDLFSDLKLSLVEKESIWLLCDAQGDILWVVGYRASSHASVSRKTKKVVKLIVEDDAPQSHQPVVS
ncbi:MAG: tRNA lysidine(34) synthetase TilS [Bacteroidales bacterium]|nr:tRNA lysidine(34) synthetase TilS [Bacteroidales bacterium]